MTTPLDRDLAERLERLAAAVPVNAGHLDPVHASAVQARHRLRMSWLTPLVALVVIALIAGVVGIGTLNILNGPVSATARVGDFELTFRSQKSRYATGEPVELSASLTYVGQKPLVRIHHAHLTPLGFGFTEPINGVQLSPAWRLSCETEELLQGLPLVRGFRKSGGDNGYTPGFLPFMNDPNLVLPAGKWHAYAVAYFATGECGGGEEFRLRADLTIEVVDRPTPTSRPTGTPPVEEAALHIVNLEPDAVEVVLRSEVVVALACGETAAVTPETLDAAPPWAITIRTMDGTPLDSVTLDGQLPRAILIRDGAASVGRWPMTFVPSLDPCVPRATPDATLDESQTSTETDGDFEFTFTSDKRAYRPNEPIRIEARLTYRGSSNSVEIGYDTRPISFRIAEKVFGKIQVGGISLLTCGAATLVRDVPLVVPFEKVGPVDNEGPDADELMAWMIDPVLRLPVGTWHITAAASSPCMGLGITFHVGAQLTIVVRDNA